MGPDTFQKQYDELSDEALLSIEREDLIETARLYYDAEVARRGLQSEEATADAADAEEALVPVETFESSEEASFGRALLRGAGIPAYLESELAPRWSGPGGLRLMVPPAYVEQAKEILESQISEEDLIAQAEAAEHVDSDPDEDSDSTE